MPISVTGTTWRSCEGLFCVGGAPEMGGTDLLDARYSNVGPIYRSHSSRNTSTSGCGRLESQRSTRRGQLTSEEFMQSMPTDESTAGLRFSKVSSLNRKQTSSQGSDQKSSRQMHQKLWNGGLFKIRVDALSEASRNFKAIHQRLTLRFLR